MIQTSRKTRLPIYTLTAGAVLIGLLSAGCGKRDTEQAATPPPSTAPSAATTGAPAPDTSKATTGADPSKAPPYPGMYGKPAGSN